MKFGGYVGNINTIDKFESWTYLIKDSLLETNIETLHILILEKTVS